MRNTWRILLIGVLGVAIAGKAFVTPVVRHTHTGGTHRHAHDVHSKDEHRHVSHDHGEHEYHPHDYIASQHDARPHSHHSHLSHSHHYGDHEHHGHENHEHGHQHLDLSASVDHFVAAERHAHFSLFGFQWTLPLPAELDDESSVLTDIGRDEMTGPGLDNVAQVRFHPGPESMSLAFWGLELGDSPDHAALARQACCGRLTSDDESLPSHSFPPPVPPPRHG